MIIIRLLGGFTCELADCAAGHEAVVRDGARLGVLAPASPRVDVVREVVGAGIGQGPAEHLASRGVGLPVRGPVVDVVAVVAGVVVDELVKYAVCKGNRQVAVSVIDTLCDIKNTEMLKRNRLCCVILLLAAGVS